MFLIIFFSIFILLLVIGSPIYMALIVPSIVYFILNQELSLMLITQRMLVSLNSFPLLAVPFFILAASIMNESSVTNRIFTFAKIWATNVFMGML